MLNSQSTQVNRIMEHKTIGDIVRTVETGRRLVVTDIVTRDGDEYVVCHRFHALDLLIEGKIAYEDSIERDDVSWYTHEDVKKIGRITKGQENARV